MNRNAAIAAALALTACQSTYTPQVSTLPTGATPQQLAADTTACQQLEYHNRVTAALLGGLLGPLAAAAQYGLATTHSAIADCLTAKGYSVTP